ncbi:MAG: HypC/HybG/HupF family hydrogenase formation chaperone [Candidatus Omnitrophota bacterium]|nr:HypC/HybG/HupF family hydrogenase formation chaperone [Candidatus Omnitrophota bacterium]
MCLAIPMKVVSLEKEFATVEVTGVKRKVNIQMLPNIKPKDYIIVHAGFAIQKVDEKQAKETLRMFKL